MSSRSCNKARFTYTTNLDNFDTKRGGGGGGGRGRGRGGGATTTRLQSDDRFFKLRDWHDPPPT
jgi:hypothetical protein